MLSEIGRIAKSSLLYKAEYVIEHASKFLTSKFPDARDILLQAFQLTETNCRMPYDELMKVKMDSFNCTKHGISFSVEERKKTYCFSRRYVLRPWPGDLLNKCFLMDSRVALTSWVLSRGDASGYLFVNITGRENLRIMHDEPWSKQSNITFMRRRLHSIGIPYVQTMSQATVEDEVVYSYCVIWM